MARKRVQKAASQSEVKEGSPAKSKPKICGRRKKDTGACDGGHQEEEMIHTTVRELSRKKPKKWKKDPSDNIAIESANSKSGESTKGQKRKNSVKAANPNKSHVVEDKEQVEIPEKLHKAEPIESLGDEASGSSKGAIKSKRTTRKNRKPATSKQKDLEVVESTATGSVASVNKIQKQSRTVKKTSGQLSTAPKTIKVISWNVAGIRAWLKKNAHRIVEDELPDLFGLQETKCSSVPGEMNIESYHHYLESPLDNAGHAGVMLLTKQLPSKLVYGSDLYEDARGRLIIADFDRFYFINSYVPNSGRGLVNLEKRKRWEDWFIEEIKKLDAEKPVIYSGDLNVAHEEIDLANPKTNRNKTAGFTDQERNDFTRLLNAGFVDVYRKLNPEKEGMYTFWSNMRGARLKNIGWRLDYFVISERIFKNVKRCEILSDCMGSDHCPILLEISL